MSHLFYGTFDAAIHQRRFAPVASAPPFSAARRAVGNSLFEETPWAPSRRAFAPATAAPGGNVGRSAAVSLTFTGKGDDGFLNLALAINAGLALAVDPSQALAVEILDAWSGRSAARIV